MLAALRSFLVQHSNICQVECAQSAQAVHLQSSKRASEPVPTCRHAEYKHAVWVRPGTVQTCTILTRGQVALDKCAVDAPSHAPLYMTASIFETLV
jgi:hypothetical protein